MKNFQKIGAVIISVMVAMSCMAVLPDLSPTARANDTAVFELLSKEETDTEITVEFGLVNGSFNSIDMQFIVSSNISKCSSIIVSDTFKSFEDEVEESGNLEAHVMTPMTMKVSMSSTYAYSKQGRMFKATFVKNKSLPVTKGDIDAKVITCSKIDAENNAQIITTSCINKLSQNIGKCGLNLSYRYDSIDKVLSITGTGRMYDYSILSAPWKDFSNSIETINIGSGIESIGKCAFSLCTRLTSVSIPSSVKTIGDGAFSGCRLLKSILIDSNVKTIGNDAFKGCTELVITCNFGSSAYNYALKNNIDFKVVEEYIIGDVDSNWIVNSSDALLLLQFAVEEKQADEAQKFAGDINNDGIINSVDALTVLEASVGMCDIMSYQR